jgi:hypothetical protein
LIQICLGPGSRMNFRDEFKTTSTTKICICLPIT